jgi:hypothetical protein
MLATCHVCASFKGTGKSSYAAPESWSAGFIAEEKHVNVISAGCSNLRISRSAKTSVIYRGFFPLVSRDLRARAVLRLITAREQDVINAEE